MHRGRRRQHLVRCSRLHAARARGQRWRAANTELRNQLDSLHGIMSPRCARNACADNVDSEVAALRAEVATLQERLEWETRRWHTLRVSSPLTDVHFWETLTPEMNGNYWRWWKIWCPCCKRPLDVTTFSSVEAWTQREQPRSLHCSLPEPRFAYAASLWGANPGYVLGALVLGQSLRRSGTVHDLVLMHTDEVPRSALKFLAQVWSLKSVDFIDASSDLFTLKGTRFDGVFTKLHALGLVEYTKVLMLDLDLAILECPDKLFQLRAPAALCRGMMGTQHGALIDGRRFFAPEILEDDDNAYEWGQHGGINAGVMLFEPDAALHARTLREVRTKIHPERIPGNGPEQDYLSRLFAPSWSHIGVQHNFQLHHVFFALEAVVAHLTGVNPNDSTCGQNQAVKEEAEAGSCVHEQQAAPEPWLPSRLSLDVKDIATVHFSGELKMWHREHLGQETDEVFADRLLRSNSPYSSRLWLDRYGHDWEYAKHGVRLSEGGSWEPCNAAGPPVAEAIEQAVRQARAAARRAAQQWRHDLEALSHSFPQLPPLELLLQQLHQPSWPAAAPYPLGARVEVWWPRAGQWFAASVVAARDDGALSVTFDEPGYWGSGTSGLRSSSLRPLIEEEEGRKRS